MHKRLVGVRLILAEPLEDDRVRAFTEQLDLAVRTTNDRRHALAGRVELAHVEDLVLQRLAVRVDEH